MPIFEELDARIASALNRIIHNSHLKRRISLEEQKGTKKEDRFLRGRQIASTLFARRRLVEDQDTNLELTCKIQELQNEINCMNDLRDFQDAEDQYAVDIPTLPVNLCLSHLIQFLMECKAVLLGCRAAEKGRQAFGTRMAYRETVFFF